MPTLSNYIAASQSARNRSPSPALTPLGVVSEVDADGFYGAAYLTKSNQIIVAFAPLSLDITTPYGRGSSLAGADIARGQSPSSFNTSGDVGNFMAQVFALAAGRPIFATGFSLGGVTAEYVAKTYGLGGAAFGAPGLPGNLLTSSAFKNYVNYGDPAAIAGSDTAFGVGMGIANQAHYGAIVWVGNPADQQTLTSAAQNALANGYLFPTFAGQFLADTHYHDLDLYAADLGVTTPAAPEGAVIGSFGRDGPVIDITAAGQTLAYGGSPFSVIATGDTITAPGARLTVSGGNDVVNLASNGAADLFGASYTTHGDNCTVLTEANSSVNVDGIRDTINAPYASDYVGITHTGDLSNINTINAASGASIGEITGAAANIVGNGWSLVESPGAYTGVFGTNESILNAGNCTIGAPAGSTWNQTGSNVTDILSPNCYMGELAGSSDVAIRGSNDNFGMQIGTTATIKGSNDGFTAYDAGIGLLNGDQGINLNANDCQVTSLKNTSFTDTNGDNSTFGGLSGDTMVLYGNNMVVSTNYSNILFVGSYDTCDGNGNTVNSTGVSDYCYGYGDTALGTTEDIYGPPNAIVAARAQKASDALQLLQAQAPMIEANLAHAALEGQVHPLAAHA